MTPTELRVADILAEQGTIEAVASELGCSRGRALYLASQLKWALGLSGCPLSRLRRELAG